MKIRAILIVVASLFVFGQGCAAGTAQLTESTPAGGTVEVHGPYMPSMSRATRVMAEHCDGRFRITDSERGNREAQFACEDGRVSVADIRSPFAGHPSLSSH